MTIEDAIVQTHACREYCAAELRLVKHNHRSRDVVFSGLVIEAPLIDLPRAEYPIAVTPRRFRLFGPSEKVIEGVPESHRVLTHSADYARQFLNARYMDVFCFLCMRYGDSKIGIAFFEDALIIKIHQDYDFFESLTCLKKTSGPREVKQIVKDTHALKKILAEIDEVKSSPFPA